jgi:hypothetical protein
MGLIGKRKELFDLRKEKNPSRDLALKKQQKSQDAVVSR